MIRIEEKLLAYTAEGFTIGDWTPKLEVDGESLSLDGAEFTVRTQPCLTLTCYFPAKSIEWEIRIDQTSSKQESICNDLLISSTIRNTGATPVALGKALLLDSRLVRFGSVDDDVVVLPSQVGRILSVYRLTDKELPRQAKVKAQFYNRTEKRAMQVGFVTFQRSNTEITIGCSAERGLHSLSAYCDFAGWELGPGAATESERLRIVVCGDPYEQLESWADIAAGTINPTIWQDAPIGYLGWSWTDVVNGEKTYEEITYENLDAINERLGGLGVRYLWTSMSNVDGSLPGNWLKWNTRCIPSGRESFLRTVQEKGFVPGFWVGPFYLCSTLDEMMDELSDAILQNPDGSPMVVCKAWRHGDSGMLPADRRPDLYALDPSHPKVLKYARRIFETYYEWGVRYYMVDFLEAGAGNVHRFPYKEHHDTSLVAGPEAYVAFLAVMKEAAGKGTYLLSSTGPSLHNAGVVDGARVGNDFGEGRAISPQSFFYPASYVINNLSFWTGAKYALTNQAGSYYTHRVLYLNDSANVLTVDKPIPLSHAQVHATIHAFSGGPTMLGDDIRQIDEGRLELIRKTLPRSKDIGRPLDLFDSVSPEGPRVFQRHISSTWGEYDVVAVYNLDLEPLDTVIDLAKLKLDIDRDYLVWELWDSAFLGTFRGELSLHVPPGSVKVLRFALDQHRPTLVGTDMHVMMGEMEIDEYSYNDTTMTCFLSAKRPEGLTGMAFVHAPDSVFIRNPEGLHIAKDVRDNSLIIGVPLRFDAAGKAQRQIIFGPLRETLDPK